MDIKKMGRADRLIDRRTDMSNYRVVMLLEKYAMKKKISNAMVYF